MKELSQYKEEIFRRSEVKIRQRKTRRRIALGISIPLCLCLVVSGTVFGKQLTGFKSDSTAERAPECEIALDSMVPGRTYRIQDPALWQEILDTPIKENHKVEGDGLLDSAEDATTEVLIILVGQERYQLVGRTLYHEATGEVRTLSDEQLQQLEVLLEQEKKNRFTARVLEYGDSWVLVEPLEGEPERDSSDKISFSTGNLDPLDIQVGTLVDITYDGRIMESYPAQIDPDHWELASIRSCTSYVGDPPS